MNFLTGEKNCFTDEEKKSCFAAVEKMHRYAVTARSRGLIALGEEIKKESDPLVVKGLSLIREAYAPYIVRKILDNYITFSGFEGKRLLESMIITEAVLLIQQGTNPDLTESVLLSFFGIDGEKMYEEYEKENR